jgi:hypothetical protein
VFALAQRNACADRRHINSAQAQMVHELERHSAPDTQRSAFAFAFAV